eukprot:3404197-Prorocentrum_lima.AAC.1
MTSSLHMWYLAEEYLPPQQAQSQCRCSRLLDSCPSLPVITLLASNSAAVHPGKRFRLCAFARVYSQSQSGCP